MATKRFIFSWNAWTIEHIAKHGVLPEEAIDLVLHAAVPFPRAIDDDKAIDDDSGSSAGKPVTDGTFR